MDENEKKLNDKDVKVIRTYTSDMVDAIRTNEISVIKIALAEKEKREREDLYKKAEGTSFTKIILVIGSIILIAAAIYGSYYLIQKKKESEIPKTSINNIKTFISYDSQSNINVTNMTNANDLTNIINNDKQPSSLQIKALFLTRTINNVVEILTSKDFLSLINTTIPGALERSLSDKYLLGEYGDTSNPVNNTTATFLVFETTDYNQAYASMLDWEKTMLRDLHVLFNISIPEQNSPLYERSWKDIIVNNKDARVLYNDNGEGILYYVFVNKNDFVITDNLVALKEVIARLITQNASTL